MAFNVLDELRQAGVVTDRTPPATLDVLSDISEDEARFLSSLNARIKAAQTPEVVAHSEEGEEDAPCDGVFICGVYSGMEIN